MTAADQRRNHPTMRWLAPLLAALVLAAPLGLVWWAQRSSASFADSEVIGVNSLGAATLDVDVGDLEVDLRSSSVAPGDTVGGQVEIRNAGTLPLRYAVLASTSGGLLAELVLWDFWLAPTCADRPPADAGGPRAVTIGRDPVPIVGDAGIGLQAGDRRLAEEGSETLCVLARLPLEAPNEVQGATAELTISVVAEHDVEVDE